jgi:hypothetical protein
MGSFKATCLLLAICFSMPANAWWADEHRVVAIIADKHLSDQARIEVRRILGDVSLEEVANWADSIKSQSRWKHSKAWHYMNLARDADIADYQPMVGGDILWALDYFYNQLKASGTSTADRRQALQFFVHLVADIHQPLHVGLPDDRGGNRVMVRWFNGAKLQNLHKVWDGLLTANELTATDYVKRLNTVKEEQIKIWQDSTFVDWATESQQLLEQVYSFGVENKDSKILELGEQYLHANRSLAERRLVQAGIRLAYYLNSAFKRSAGQSML